MHQQCTTLDIPDTPHNAPGVTGCLVMPSVLAKTTLVWLLAWVLAWRPSLAMYLGRLVLRVWPHFRRV